MTGDRGRGLHVMIFDDAELALLRVMVERTRRALPLPDVDAKVLQRIILEIHEIHGPPP